MNIEQDVDRAVPGLRESLADARHKCRIERLARLHDSISQKRSAPFQAVIPAHNPARRTGADLGNRRPIRRPRQTVVTADVIAARAAPPLLDREPRLRAGCAIVPADVIAARTAPLLEQRLRCRIGPYRRRKQQHERDTEQPRRQPANRTVPPRTLFHSDHRPIPHRLLNSARPSNSFARSAVSRSTQSAAITRWSVPPSGSR